MKRLSKKLLYTLGVTLLCGGMQLHAQSLDQAKNYITTGNTQKQNLCSRN